MGNPRMLDFADWIGLVITHLWVGILALVDHTMKEPSIAPGYTFLYPLLCKAARENGYALALHGTMQRDMDLVAIPWVSDAQPREVLVEALKVVLDGYILNVEDHPHLPEASPVIRPHGRMAWSIYITNGFYVDLSVMPTSDAFIDMIEKEITQEATE